MQCSSRGILLLAFLATLCALLPAAEGKKKGSSRNRPGSLDKELQQIRVDCVVQVDSRGGECVKTDITRENCILKCASGACYQQVYGVDPLEEGEIDTSRGRIFRNCARNELRQNKALASEQAKREEEAQRKREEEEAAKSGAEL